MDEIFLVLFLLFSAIGIGVLVSKTQEATKTEWDKNSRKRIEAERKALAKNQGIPSCPKCGSSYITAKVRGSNAVSGFIGRRKTVNRCTNCGHTWEPK